MLEVFFQVIVLNGPLCKVTYHAIRVEFQGPGSTHVHSFQWILDAPILSEINVDEYIRCVDGNVKANVPKKHENLKFFPDHTIIALPLPCDTFEEKKDSTSAM